VTVGTKPDGAKGLLLDYVPETARIKPKAEVLTPVKKASKAAKPKELESVGAEPDAPAKPKKAAKAAKADEPVSATAVEPPRKGSTVPKVPRKK
jgi:ATP-dependent Clp protease ATP-binding subunit ClpA